jgi:hypothetical protein
MHELPRDLLRRELAFQRAQRLVDFAALGVDLAFQAIRVLACIRINV